jgi:2,3-bisphosphoglycerate-dependent phosphoglycerate mutase
VDSRSWKLAAERAPLWCSSGTEQGRDSEAFWRRAGQTWRRSYAIAPPAAKDNGRNPPREPRYAALKPEEMPLTESLKDVLTRLLPYWHESIAPAIAEGKRALIVAHGNTLRAVVKFLDGISDEEIVQLNIPTGKPLVYELRDDLTPIRSFYLGE